MRYVVAVCCGSGVILTDVSKLATPFTQAREEIMIHEQLKLRPHPNIVKYHGVLVENGYVVGIVLDKLDIDLQTAVSEPTKPSHAWTVERVMKDVKEGLEHLHSIGIMHVSFPELGSRTPRATDPQSFLWSKFPIAHRVMCIHLIFGSTITDVLS